MAIVQSKIVGSDGEPIRYEVLDQEISAGGVTSIRNPWHSGVADNLGPERLAAILRGAAEGEGCDYLTLAEEMEERDGHYASVLSTRKLALVGLDIRVDALSDEARDVEIADQVRAIVAAPEFSDVVLDLTDALGKGYSVVEIIWDRSGKVWTPERFEHRDPRFFRWDRTTGRQLRMLDEADPVNGIALAPYKFVVHQPKLRSGLPVRAGLARLAAVAYMCKAWAWKDWMAFADVFGLPMRVGTYGPGAKEEDIARLMRAVANLGSDAAAVIHESTRIAFEAAPNTAGAAEFFERLAMFWDKQVSKAVLGQTMTADDGASLSQAQVHNEVRLDLLKADARALQGTLNQCLVRPFVDLNIGAGRYPQLVVSVPEPEDIRLLVEALEALVPLGLEVEQSVIRDKLGLPDPAEGKGVKLLRAPIQANAATPAPGEESEVMPAAERAQNRQLPAAAPDALDDLADEALGGWEPIMAPMRDSVQAVIDDAVERGLTAGELIDLLAQRLPLIDDAALADALGHASFVARMAGAAGRDPE